MDPVADRKNNYGRRCANKLGGGCEREKHSERPSATTMTVTAKILGRDCSCLLLFDGGETAPPTNKQMLNDNEKRHGAKISSDLCRAGEVSGARCSRVFSFFLCSI